MSLTISQSVLLSLSRLPDQVGAAFLSFTAPLQISRTCLSLLALHANMQGTAGKRIKATKEKLWLKKCEEVGYKTREPPVRVTPDGSWRRRDFCANYTISGLRASNLNSGNGRKSTLWGALYTYSVTKTPPKYKKSTRRLSQIYKDKAMKEAISTPKPNPTIQNYHPSPTLLAANRRLYELRAQHRIRKTSRRRMGASPPPAQLSRVGGAE